MIKKEVKPDFLRFELPKKFHIIIVYFKADYSKEDNGKLTNQSIIDPDLIGMIMD
jgi:hypothetical protein